MLSTYISVENYMHDCLPWYDCMMQMYISVNALQIPKYEGHTKLPQWSYQIQIWYDHCGNLV